jgi:hypothetical protein
VSGTRTDHLKGVRIGAGAIAEPESAGVVTQSADRPEEGR